MAVRHGYGKIEGTDALVFAYDTGDTVNSYKGEPTENLALNPTFSSTASWSVSSNGGGSFSASGNYGKINAGSVGSYSFLYQNQAIAVSSNESVTWSVDFKNNVVGDFAIRLVLFLDGVVKAQPSVYFSLDGTGGTVRKSVTTSHVDGASDIRADIMQGSYYGNINTDTDVEFTNAQLERNTHATPFVNGTRSATEGLKDLTGNTSIDLTNAGFDSNAQLDFDGTSGYFETPVLSLFNLNAKNFSVETVFYGDPSLDSANVYTGIVTLIDSANSVRLRIAGTRSALTGLASVYTVNDGIAGFVTVAYGGYTYGSYDYTYPGKYTHLVYMADYTNNVQRLYINGELYATKSYNTFTNTDCRLIVGKNETNNYLDGKVDVAKFYNRALTAAEVKNNYRHYKNRFGI